MNTKPKGFRPVQSWYWNHCVHQIFRNGGHLCLCGKPILDLAPSSSILLKSQLVVGGNLRHGSRAETYIKLRNNSTLRVQQRFQLFFGSSVEVADNATLIVGLGYLNTGSSIMCTQSITVGNGVFIGRNTYITDSDHHKLLDMRGHVLNPSKSIYIGNHVWIGYGVIILKGVTIGDGAVVAAGSVVTRDIPPRCLAAGVPARVIKENVEWK